MLFMGTYPPRECGIATFTQDLSTAMDKKFNPKLKSKIVAMDFPGLNYNYPDEVILNINQDNIQEYINVARKINETDSIKLVNIQHEFGIFGGYYGKHLLKFVETLNKPMIITLHTIVPESISKSNTRKRVLQEIVKKAKQVIVLNKLGINILEKDYEIDVSKVVVIPHGIHDINYEESINEKIKLGYENNIILSSFGFVSRHKGYEYIIDALPQVIKKFPNVIYLIVGGIHPKHYLKEGNKYLMFLKNKVKVLGLEKNVEFTEKYEPLNNIIN